MVLEKLKERLFAGCYAPGSRISIEELKAEFGVSKQPLLDALRRLEAIGIVEIVPQSGCRVSSYSMREVRDFFNLFGRFEGEIAAAAASRRAEQQLIVLDQAWQRISEIEGSESGKYRCLNREFHLTIHRWRTHG